MLLLKKVRLLSSNDDKRIQSFDSIETYAYGTNKVLVVKKEEFTIQILLTLIILQKKT